MRTTTALGIGSPRFVVDSRGASGDKHFDAQGVERWFSDVGEDDSSARGNRKPTGRNSPKTFFDGGRTVAKKKAAKKKAATKKKAAKKAAKKKGAKKAVKKKVGKKAAKKTSKKS